MTENNEKSININGTHNRYLIKKLKKEPKNIQIRKHVNSNNLSENLFLLETQESIISEIYNNKSENKDFLQHIEKKLNSYKNQDILKKRYNKEEFITTSNIISKLYECKLLCYYCEKKTYIIYDIVRETKQWTLDRINNDIGHNTDNVVISCLECNLKRRRINKDAFLFTKKLNIIKTNEIIE